MLQLFKPQLTKTTISSLAVLLWGLVNYNAYAESTTPVTAATADTEQTTAQTPPLSQREDIQAFIQQMVKKHQFDQAELQDLFDQVVIQQEIIDKMTTPAESKAWDVYKPIFISPERAQQGADFYQQHKDTILKAEKEFGVPGQVIVAILGVETLYGKFQGKYRVIDALTTLSFEYPSRADFFRSELEQFLLLTRENALAHTDILGSYAGAIGAPQFMPSSYRTYAVAYSGNETKDLQHNTADAIGSIANYLKKKGWAPDQPIVTQAQVDGSKYRDLPPQKMRPELKISELAEYGITPTNTSLNDDDKAVFLYLNTESKPEYWLGFQNFYVITRYNPRVNYAMAVYELSEEIGKRIQPE